MNKQTNKKDRIIMQQLPPNIETSNSSRKRPGKQQEPRTVQA